MVTLQLLQINVISKRENSLGYIGGQVNSLTGLPSVIQVKSIVEHEYHYLLHTVILSKTPTYTNIRVLLLSER